MIPNKNRLGQMKANQKRITVKNKPTFICSWCKKVLPLKQMAEKVAWLDGQPLCKHCKKRTY